MITQTTSLVGNTYAHGYMRFPFSACKLFSLKHNLVAGNVSEIRLLIHFKKPMNVPPRLVRPVNSWGKGLLYVVAHLMPLTESRCDVQGLVRINQSVASNFSLQLLRSIFTNKFENMQLQLKICCLNKSLQIYGKVKKSTFGLFLHSIFNTIGRDT